MQKTLTFCIKMTIFICRKEQRTMHRFDYSFLHNGMLPAGLLNITVDIYILRVKALDRKEQYMDVFTELAAIAKV